MSEGKGKLVDEKRGGEERDVASRRSRSSSSSSSSSSNSTAQAETQGRVRETETERGAERGRERDSRESMKERLLIREDGTLARYAKWYRANETWIVPFEQALQSAIWFIPDAGNAQSEVGIEVLHALASLWTVANEQVTLLTEKNEELERLRSVNRNLPHALLPLLVATVEQFETVIECVLVHKLEEQETAAGGKGRYKWLALLEAFKAVVRIGQLCKSEGSSCMLLDGGLSGVGKALDVGSSSVGWKQAEAFRTFRAKYLVRPTGATISKPMPMLSPSSSSAADDFQLDISRSDAQLLTLAEMLHIFRPVIYCSLLWKDGTKSWKPWVTSLTVELTSLAITHKVTRSASCLKGNPLCVREAEARWARLVLYLARSPFYDGVTNKAMLRFRNWLQPVPLLGMASSAGYDMLDQIQKFYTYTSG
eukprot:CAMPEP_0197479024 /NCGR_PEP_ID=MMETSP1309-20131121/31009_1 /TAXON_ID=464262 /ORGANISM="Genus nov. species nov., Strain RCC998" /LENGTH=423 /DNA_ID=CAMNT_0043020591 /DNA_START=36 /DNA_END=1307 /DNA_ORIENTATION=+